MLSKFNYMKNIATIIALICLVQTGFGQSMTIKFCGKTNAVSPTIDPNNGQDQRGKAAIRLDYIKVGIIGNSLYNHFYNLGDDFAGFGFPNSVFVDQCDNATGSLTTCAQCNVCKNITSKTGVLLGVSEGRMLGNVKIEGKNNDLYLMSTGDNNVVCYETDRIWLFGQKNKKIEVSVKYEGIAQGGYTVKNINMNYRYDNNAYFSTPYFFNKNSNNTGVFTETYVIQNAVPNAVQDLSSKLSFEINPNPIIDQLKIEYGATESFNGSVHILNDLSQELKSTQAYFNEGEGVQTVDVNELKSGFYFVLISDSEGRTSVKKFIK